MRLPVTDLAALDRAIADGTRSDYIYMYPPRQAYRTLGAEDDKILRLKTDSLRIGDRVNVYVHIPFCQQICGFCNLYTTASRDSELRSRYVAALRRQIHDLGTLLQGGRTAAIATMYLGGGTPTSLSVADLRLLVESFREACPSSNGTTEYAIEADPQTVDDSSLRALHEIGFTRISFGFQSRVSSEIRSIGRQTSPDEQAESVERALSAGFTNVCVDLIYGLPGQSPDAWTHSVEACIDLGPQTICCYPLTLRPNTGFGRKGHVGADGKLSYRLWETADELLKAAGYVQETHVRWSLNGGGYLQKQLHWGMENVVGLGAGARSYLCHIDTRYGYSILQRRRVLTEFLSRSEAGLPQPVDGYVMTSEERLRKAVVLGLFNLDVDKAQRLSGSDPLKVFEVEFEGLIGRGLLREADNRRLALTTTGSKYRDLIVQMFFSPAVRALAESFDYNE
ncbi:MAG: coproporphyrinogen-III oxidase family protein [Gammaproteobacteria bacterium]